VITLNTDRPVQHAIITADGEPPATASPRYPDDGGTRPWPYELRFYDPPVDGFVATLRLPGAGLPRIYVSDYTMGLEQVPGFKPRPVDLARSPVHNSDIVVVGRSLKPDQRRFSASRGSAVAARASSGPWRREPPPAG
jgi:hypothetical protein